MKLDYEKQQAILENHIEVQEQTLKNISEEIHDNIGQVLSLAKLNLYTLKPNEDQKLEDTKLLISKALNDLRDLSRSLHGDKIVELGLQESIANELNILQHSGQFQTSLDVIGAPFKLDAHKETIIFRILQESLHNVIKHSQATNIHIEMEYGCDTLNLSIQDDGIGFNVDQLQSTKTGIGLKSMQNRAELAGGKIQLSSKRGSGTTLLITINR